MTSREYRMKAEKIVSYKDLKNGVSIQFEDCTYADSIRVFMNTTENDAPIFFFIPVRVAAILFWDLFDGRHVEFSRTGHGTRRGKEHWRSLSITTLNTYEGIEYQFEMVNSDDSGELSLSIVISSDETRVISVSVLPHIFRWMARF